MNDPLLIAQTLPHGYTWTLASRLGDMLTFAEELFGARNKQFTILGIEFNDSGPRIWYPKSKENIVIQLSLEALNSETLALYQLAHECIHLLSPSGSANANVLEEGLAVYFSWWYLKEALGLDGKNVTNSDAYKTAGLLVEKLLHLNPEFFLQVRSSHPRFWELHQAQIKTFCPQLSWREVATLAMPFDQFKAHLTSSTGPIPKFISSDPSISY